MRKRKAFTLIEVIVGIVVIAIISLASFEFFRYCRKFIVDSELRLATANFARETLERYIWDDEDETAGWINANLPTGAEFGSKLRDEYNGTRQYKVEDSADGDYRIITSRVSWEY